MTSIAITETGFTINGTPSHVVADSLALAGLSSATIAEIVGGWFIGVTGSSEPVPFRFDTDVEAADQNCVVDYARQFGHVDWIDGESRVQAGMTPEELGVNARFHSIENEFDAIADQFARLGNCVTGIRSDLFGVVDELEDKITTLQNQVHALEQEHRDDDSGPMILGTATIDGHERFVTRFGDDFRFVQFDSEPIITNPVGPIINVFEPGDLTPDELIELVIEVDEVLTQPGFDELFRGDNAVTVREIRRAGSEVVLPSGITLGSVIAALPSDTAFRNRAEAVSAIIGDVAEEVPDSRVSDVRRRALTDDVASRTGGALMSSGVNGVTSDETVANVLNDLGFGTIARLAGADRSEVMRAVVGHGTPVSGAAVERAIANAVVSRAFRNRT